MQIDLFEDNAGGLHLVDRERVEGFRGFEMAQNRAEYRALVRDEFTLASDAPDFDSLADGALYEPIGTAAVGWLYESEGEVNGPVCVATWTDGAIEILSTNLGSSARWYLCV